MRRDRQIAMLLDDAMRGGLSRREVLQRAAALGIGMPAFAALIGRAQLAQARQGHSPVASPAAVAGPPVAEVIPSTREFEGREIVDPYAWLENPDDPKVIAYLEAENAYTASVLAPTTDLQDTLYNEFIARIPQETSQVPYRIGDYYYYSRFEEGKGYEIIARRLGSPDAEEEILLDLNEIAGEYLALVDFIPSPDHRYISCVLDESGGLDYTIYVLDTTTGDMLDDVIPGADGCAWANYNATLVYTRLDDALRPFEILTHTLGDDPANDPVILTEPDEIFGLYIFKSNDGRYIIVTPAAYGTSEALYIDADGPDFEPRMLAARREGIEVYADHGTPGFIATTNEDAPNFKIVVSPDDAASPTWTDLVPAQESRLIDGFDVLRDYLGIYGRENGFSQVWTYSFADESLTPIPFEEESYTVYAGTNLDFEATTLRIGYTSMVTPYTDYDIDLETNEKTLLQQSEVLGNHDPDAYVSERVFATAPDGTEIPISLVYRADLRTGGPMPLRLDGYGSYGINSEPAFSALRLSLINRGAIYAIAHIRGGSEMGRHWWDEGKLLDKKNTFTDYIACAEHLVNEGYTTADRLLGNGGSAGGLLMGAAANMAPDRFGSMVAAVPFVDVLRVMLDPTLPLTTGEYVEWGNPAEDEYYEYIRSYSPYDNVTAQNYPAFYITAGINDDQVPYWQPAKWTAKLRATKTDDNVLLLQTNLGAGHQGASDRDAYYVETAQMYAFMLTQMGIADVEDDTMSASGIPARSSDRRLAASRAVTNRAKASINADARRVRDVY